MKPQSCTRILAPVALLLFSLACDRSAGPGAARAAEPAMRPVANTPATPAQEDYLRTTLDNGLRVVLVEDHTAPVVALNVWVRTGSADERPEEAGMAHVFEHMLFKGTQKRAVGEIAATVEGAGGDINAFTSYDMTVYHITMASRDAATGVDVLADAVRNSSFDPEALAKESEVVVEEINRGRDMPGTILSEALFATAFKKHPYRLPVIGTEKSVRSFSRQQLLDFYARWYSPNNMTFIAVGDFEKDAMLGQIRQVFADAKPREDLAHQREMEPAQNEPRAVLLREKFEQAQLSMAFPITRFADEDTPYVDLLGSVLGEGESSRLYRAIKDQQQLVYEISTGAYTPLDPGLMLVDAVLDPGKIEPAIRAVGQEIERLRSFGPSAVELERARVNLLASVAREKENVQGQARKYGYFETLGSGIESEAVYLERVRKATVGDLKRVALEYLKPERATVVAMVPEKARPELSDAILLSELKQGFRTDDPPQGKELAQGIRSYELPNGLRVVVKPTKSVPIVSLRLSFLGGQLAETEKTQGISAFLAQMIDRGTERRNAAQLRAEVESIAGALDGFSGRNSFGLTAEFMTESLDNGLELFADTLLHPQFPQEEIDKVRSDTLAAISRLEDNLQGQVFELFSRTLYPGHPYRFRTIGTKETVSKIDQAALRKYYEAYASPRNAVLGVVGDVDPDQIAGALRIYLADWKDRAPAKIPDRKAPQKPAKPLDVKIEKNKAQVHVVVGFPGVALNDPDAPALEVLTQLLSGQSGRLFIELRDKQSLAYTTTAFLIPGVDPGSFGAYIASAPVKLEEARSGLLRELKRVLDEPIEESEVEKARRYLIGAQAVSLQDYGAQASVLSLDELYGQGATNYLGYADRIGSVTPDDVKRVAQRIIQLDTPVIATVR
jgi:zinc protease